MCGIFGYLGNKNNAGDLVLEGLKKLEYRGYDSWGIVCFNDRELEVKKEVGKIGEVQVKFSPSSLGLGQTRWATHGGVTRANAHPHLDCSKRLAVVHNGIVENYQELKKKLKGRHTFKSETDTEVFVHLVEDELKIVGSLKEAVRRSFYKLQGLNAFVVLDSREKVLIAVKRGSPLVIGLGQGENFIASDSLGIVKHTNRLIFLEDDQLACLRPGSVEVFDLRSGDLIENRVHEVKWLEAEGKLGKFKHFFEKEIHDQPSVVKNVLRNKGAEVSYFADLIRRSFGTYFVGCGTASYAALAGTYFFSSVANHHVNFSIGSEFNYLLNFIKDESLVVGVSQSGETADIIESVNRAKQCGAKIASVVNVEGSSLFRLSDFKILVEAGQERAVISTKAFCGQVAILLYAAFVFAGKGEEGVKILESTRKSLSSVLGKESQRKIKKLASKISKSKHVYIIGRGISYPAALESALKIKEACYIHAEGFAAGELKHGVIALIEKGSPCLVLAPLDETHGATLAAAMEVKARGGFIIGLSSQNNEIFDEYIRVPHAGMGSIITNVAVCQTLAYNLTLIKGFDPDKPRNLAKSVTVK